jgi:hypothetical protein
VCLLLGKRLCLDLPNILVDSVSQQRQQRPERPERG